MQTKLSWLLLFLIRVNLIIAHSVLLPNDVQAAHGCPKQEKTILCTTPGCIHAASNVLNNMNPEIEPCDDFYQFVCGGFIKRTNIPDDSSMVISFNTIGEKVEERLRIVFEEPITENELKPFVLLKKLYNTCLDTEAIEETGLEVAKSLLNKLGGWPVLEGPQWDENEFDWKKLMFKLRKIGLPAYNFLTTYVGVDTKNSSQRVMNIDQAQLGLEREYLVQGFDNDMVQAYYHYLVSLASIFGADKEIAYSEFKEMVEFEISLAKVKYCIKSVLDYHIK